MDFLLLSILFFAGISVCATGLVDPQLHSLQPPFAHIRLPFWNIGAGAFMSQEKDYIRLTPERSRRVGFMWNTIKSQLAEWEAIFEFRVFGSSNPGEGFVFWYIERPGLVGPVFGSMDFWNGLGIFFDTLNNDEYGDSPVISAIFNDGTQRYSHADDGLSQSLATCSFPFRNLPEHHTAFARIHYSGNTFTLQIAIDRDESQHPVFADCFQIPDLVLGVDKYFGFSAGTGDHGFDIHDIISFVVSDLTPSPSDLNSIRENYHEYIEEQHAQPNHQEMNVRDFQHEVLTLLNQIQEATNMLEIAQVKIETAIHSMFHSPTETQQQTWGTVTLVDTQAHQLEAASANANKTTDFLGLIWDMTLSGKAQQNIQDPARILNEIRPMINNQFARMTDSLKAITSSIQYVETQTNIIQEAQRNTKGPSSMLYLLTFLTLCGALANTFLIFRSRQHTSKDQ